MTAYWIGKLRFTFQNVKRELEREIDADGIRRQLHNEEVIKVLDTEREKLQQEAENVGENIYSKSQVSRHSTHDPNKGKE